MEVKNQYIIQLLDNITNEHKEKALNNFVANYNAGKISLPVSYEQYLRLKDIQSRMEALGLDKDEMWFLLLFIKDLTFCIIDFEINNIGVKEKLNAVIDKIKASDDNNCSSKDIELLSTKFTKAKAIKGMKIKMIIVFLFKYLDTRKKRRSKKNENLCDKVCYVKYLLEFVFCHEEIDEGKILSIRRRNISTTIKYFARYLSVQ